MARPKKDEQTTAKKPRAKTEEEKTSNVKPIFSVRIAPEVWAKWKAYADTTKTSKGAVSTLTEKAFSEYMKKHPLKAEQAEDYDFFYKRYLKQAEEQQK